MTYTYNAKRNAWINGAGRTRREQQDAEVNGRQSIERCSCVPNDITRIEFLDFERTMGHDEYCYFWHPQSLAGDFEYNGNGPEYCG